jgi:hypothetical protein
MQIRKITETLNETLKRSEGQLQLSDLSERIQGMPDLVVPHRILIRYAESSLDHKCSNLCHQQIVTLSLIFVCL